VRLDTNVEDLLVVETRDESTNMKGVVPQVISVLDLENGLLDFFVVELSVVGCPFEEILIVDLVLPLDAVDGSALVVEHGQLNELRWHMPPTKRGRIVENDGRLGLAEIAAS
jgi:hypothetical protein